MPRLSGLVGGAAAALILASSPTLVWAQSADPAAQAAPVSDLLAGIQIPYQSFTLDNGLTVLVHEDHSNPIVTVSVWYNVGSKDEPTGRTGFAHLFEHLMFKSTKHLANEQFDRLVGEFAESCSPAGVRGGADR